MPHRLVYFKKAQLHLKNNRKSSRSIKLGTKTVTRTWSTGISDSLRSKLKLLRTILRSLDKTASSKTSTRVFSSLQLVRTRREQLQTKRVIFRNKMEVKDGIFSVLRCHNLSIKWTIRIRLIITHPPLFRIQMTPLTKQQAQKRISSKIIS